MAKLWITSYFMQESFYAAAFYELTGVPIKQIVTLIMVDDDRMPLNPGEEPTMRSVRFRTLGCYPLTGAVESHATTLPEIIQEMLLTRTSERQGRMIDHDSTQSAITCLFFFCKVI